MMPTRPAAGLVFVQPHVALLSLEFRFNAPPRTAHAGQGLQGSTLRGVGQVVAGCTHYQRELTSLLPGSPAHTSKRITLEHTFPLPRKTRRGPRATKSTREKPRKSKPKPTPEKPLTPRPQRPKPPKKDRQEYDKTRSQTPERRAYRRRYAQQKRERQKYLGLCRDCSNPAIPGQIRCPTCSEKHRQAHRRNDAKPKVSLGAASHACAALTTDHCNHPTGGSIIRP